MGFGFWNLTLGFRNSAPGIRNPAAVGIRNPSSTDKQSGIQFVESRIHSVESRIKDFFGLPYMGRNAYSAAYAPDRVDFKSVYSCVPNHSLLKEGNVLVNPPVKLKYAVVGLQLF